MMQEDSFTHSAETTNELQAVRANDDATLQRLYHHNYRYVEQFVLQNSGTVEQAKDVYQDAFIAMWRNVQAGRFVQTSTGTLDAYILRIAKNKWLDYLRSPHHKRIQLLREDTMNIATDDHVFNEDELQKINAVKEKFQQLGEQCRELLTRFYYNQASLRELALFFGWTETTARNNKYRCMERLRNLLKNLKRPE